MTEERSRFVERHQVVGYFVLTFTISWTAAALVAAPHLLRHEALPKLTGIVMFPAMLLGPSISGVLLIFVIEGNNGLRGLFARMIRWRVPPVWYLPLTLPPILVFLLLKCLQAFVSPVFAPNRFWIGILFGVPAGLLEEIGWTGFAFPKLSARMNVLAASILLGLMWGLWHLPVADFLGAASPHGNNLLAFFVSFAAAMAAMRVLICWIYSNTRSVLMAQLTHISSTGALVIFGAPRVSAGQETVWYGIYGILLWVVVTVVIVIYGPSLARERRSAADPVSMASD